MSGGIIRLSSVTYAIRAQRILEQNGMRSHIRKITQDTQLKGCGYGLEVEGGLQRASQLIRESGIRIVE